jgi:hypothetical protein
VFIDEKLVFIDEKLVFIDERLVFIDEKHVFIDEKHVLIDEKHVLIDEKHVLFSLADFGYYRVTTKIYRAGRQYRCPMHCASDRTGTAEPVGAKNESADRKCEGGVFSPQRNCHEIT